MALLTATPNFFFEVPTVWNPAAFGEAFRRATAVAATCDADLATLEDWFSVGGGFGPSNRVKVVFTNLDYGLGNNDGYSKDGGSLINIVPFTGDPNGDAAARAVFVAELAEILMDYRNKVTQRTTWLAGNSMGEALSTVCEALLHPEGYYPSPIRGPRIGPWLNYLKLPFDWHRPNWIDRTEDTDTNYVSFGCGIVFIYYLMWLGYSIKDIIAKAGSTFEETYKNLTTRSGGWKAFTDLLNFHYPEMPIPVYRPTSDNLFPLPELASITVTPPSVIAGETATATVTLDAAQGGTLVTLLSADPGYATLPSNCLVPLGKTSVDVPVSTPALTTAFPPANVLLYASYGGSSVATTLTVQSAVKKGILKSLTLNPSTVVGGAVSVATVTLEAAVDTPTVVGMAAMESGGGPGIPRGSHSSIVSVQPSVTIAAGGTQETVPIHTSSTGQQGVTRKATIVAGAVVTKSAILTIESG